MFTTTKTKIALVVGVSGVALTLPASATILTVDPLGAGIGIFKTISDAVDFADLDDKLANIYDIQITPGTYTNDYANVTRPMSLQAIGGSGVTMQSTKDLPNEKGIILTTASLFVKGITLTGAFISNALGGNGAGIRDQITGNGTLRVEDSIFQNNQEGILTGGSKGQEHVIVKNSKFLDNGNPNQSFFQHGIYVNDAATFDISGSEFCGQLIGHNIKSRSAVTTISNVESYEGTVGPGCSRAGTASRGIDIPNGGIATITDTNLFQGPLSQNSAMLEFGAEGIQHIDNSLTMKDVNLTSTSGGIGIQWFGGTNSCTLNNVTFTGLTTNQNPTGCTTTSDGGGDGGGNGGGDGGGDGGGTGGTPVPEPGSMVMLLSFLGMLVPAYKRRSNNR